MDTTGGTSSGEKLTLADFVRQDNPRGLFPLHSIVPFIEHGEADLRQFVTTKVLVDSVKEASFVPCPVAFALKDRQHLRRVLTLDPVSTFYIYDFALRNSRSFRLPPESLRQTYGHGFRNGQPLDSFKQYHEFRRRKYELKQQFGYFARVDIANCFNSFYHHYVVSFLGGRVRDGEHNHFGQFLREINGGISINCFPQGIYPAKMIGSHYLAFIESSRSLRSAAIIRFIDDIFLFDDSQATLERDVIVLQQAIGQRGLSLNSEKTLFGSKDHDFEERKLDDLKVALLRKREEAKDYDAPASAAKPDLTEEEVEYLTALIQRNDAAEEDVELALSVLGSDEEQSLKLVILALSRFPNLAKEVYKLVGDLGRRRVVWDAIISRLKEPFLTEYELFWLARTVIDHFKLDGEGAEALMAVHGHPSTTDIVKAAVLEVPDNGHGLVDLKQNALRTAPHGIAAICAVAGLRGLEKGQRNHIYTYAGKTSPYMHTLCEIASKRIPDPPEGGVTPLVTY